MKNIALVGNSDLAFAYKNKYPDNNFTCFCRPTFDITNKNNCDQIIQTIGIPDVVLITPGVVTDDLWQSMLTNAVGPSYLAIQLSQLPCSPHIIVLGSLGAEWRSWPGITLDRLVYNNSKYMLESLVKDLYHSQLNSSKLTILEPGRFQSKMSNNTGTDIENVVSMIQYVIESSDNCNILSMQGAWHNRG